MLKKRACNSHNTCLDSKILSVTKKNAYSQLHVRESVCRLRDVWFIWVHPPPSSLRQIRTFSSSWTRLVADYEEKENECDPYIQFAKMC